MSWSWSPGEQSLSENLASLSATLGRFSQTAGYVLLLELAVILACPAAREVLYCNFQNIYKQNVIYEKSME